jgi:hypothetical protein
VNDVKRRNEDEHYQKGLSELKISPDLPICTEKTLDKEDRMKSRKVLSVVTVAFAVTLIAGGAGAFDLRSLPGDLLKEQVQQPETGGTAPVVGNADDSAAESVTPSVNNSPRGESCDMVRGRTNTKIGKASFQPDKMFTDEFITKEDALRIYKEDGYTCEKSKELRDGYKIAIVCHEKYTGTDKLYKFIEAGMNCKSDKKCDQPVLYCSSERNYH